MELIDRRKLVSDFWKGVEDGSILSYEDTDNLMENAPTVDAVEVVHGWWLGEAGDFKCSVCGEYSADGGFEQTRFCPNCGAKMYGGIDNENNT